MTIDFMMNLDHIPFSRYGAYVSVNKDKTLKDLMVHYVQRCFSLDQAFLLQFRSGGRNVEYTCEMHPHCLKIKAAEGQAVMFIRDDYTLAVETTGLDLAFSSQASHGYGTSYGDKEFGVISVNQCTYSRFRIFQGEGILDGPNRPVNSHARNKVNYAQNLVVSQVDGCISLTLMISNTEQLADATPLDSASETAIIAEEWNAFLEKMPGLSGASVFTKTTWYTLWSCFVRAKDVYKYDAMLMSKKFMCSVWSWDHCFNALAMAEVDKQIALQQFLLPFEL